MGQEELLDQFKKDFMKVAKNHKTEIESSIDEYDHTFSITAMNSSVPLLQDVKMLVSAYGINEDKIDTDDGWGYVGVCFKPRFLFPQEEVDYYFGEGMTIVEFNEQTQVIKEPDQHLRELCGAARI